MLGSSAASHVLAPLTQAAWYPDDLLSEFQGALAALADIDVLYEADWERLEAWEAPAPIKRQFATQLAERHQREREPHVQRLADLHYQILKIMKLQDIGSNA
jgi:hypothetical protein